MIDADKCQYNGYTDFFNKENVRIRTEKKEKIRNK
jgi:hypothetical protein